jgi:hypothetical protein
MATRPDDTQRLVIVGTTGSGKTQAGLWHLSERNFDRKPWIVYDFKEDDMIMEIREMSQGLSMDQPIPNRPGLYIIASGPDEEEELSEHMTKVWAAQDVGVYIDEGYMVGVHNKGYRRLLTQGRSRHIPMIVLSQRPVWMDRFTFTESEFIQVFRLQHDDDLKTMEKIIHYDMSRRKPLPEYYSYYYEKRGNKVTPLRPVPDREAILDTFYSKLRMLKRVV